MLPSKLNHRTQVLDALNHFRDLDPRYSIGLPARTDVVAALRQRGAPETCYLISAVPELDGREMPLAEAIERIESAGWGTLVGCIPGRLAYYYGEQGEERTVLEKKCAKPGPRAAWSRPFLMAGRGGRLPGRRDEETSPN